MNFSLKHLSTMAFGIRWHIAAACIATGLALYTWINPPPDTRRGEVVVLNVKAKDISRIEWSEPDKIPIVIFQEKDQWFVKAANGGSEIDANIASEPILTAAPSERAYPLHPRRGENLIAKLAPLMAMRDLGAMALDDPRLAAFGLHEYTTTLQIDNGSKKLSYDVSYKPGIDPYIREPNSGQVYLLKRYAFDQFQGRGAALADRRLFGLELDAVKSLEIKKSDRSIRSYRTQLAERRTVLVDSNQDIDPVMTRWMEDLMRQQVKNLSSQKPPSAAPALEVSITLHTGQKRSLQLWGIDQNADEAIIVSDYLGGTAAMLNGNLKGIMTRFPKELQSDSQTQ